MNEAKAAPRQIELYSEVGGSPRIFKLEGMGSEAIGIEFGGKVCIKPLSEWHRLGWGAAPSHVAAPLPDVEEAIRVQMVRFGEIPDRTSPDDFPEGYILTREEIVDGIRYVLEADRAARPSSIGRMTPDEVWDNWSAYLRAADREDFRNQLHQIAAAPVESDADLCQAMMTLQHRCGYIINFCKDTKEMRLEAEAMLALLKTLKPVASSATRERNALTEIAKDLPHGERLLNACLEGLGLAPCKGTFVPKAKSFSSRWECECGGQIGNCPAQRAATDGRADAKEKK